VATYRIRVSHIRAFLIALLAGLLVLTLTIFLQKEHDPLGLTIRLVLAVLVFWLIVEFARWAIPAIDRALGKPRLLKTVRHEGKPQPPHEPASKTLKPTDSVEPVVPEKRKMEPAMIPMPSRYAVPEKSYLKLTITDQSWFDYPDRTAFAVSIQIVNENPRWAQSITQHRWEVAGYPPEYGTELHIEGGLYSIDYGEIKADVVAKGTVVCPVRLKPKERPEYDLYVMDQSGKETRALKALPPR